MASLAAQLRGSCQCGRNQYSIRVPMESSNLAQIIFDSNINHRISSASPLSAFIRIPLVWYHSEVFPFFSDESRTTIRRSYSHPNESHAQRSFCGYCGTPLSYWSEQPPSEAEYILLTLGSLLTEDLNNIHKLGLVPFDIDQDETEALPTTVPETGRIKVCRDPTSIPWFESLISGSRLGTMHTTRGVQQSRDGTNRIEFEITEWTADDSNEEGEGVTHESESSPPPAVKRKRANTDKDNIGMFAPYGTA
ncbi:hypothetical protein GGS21DRAFT_524218 [Xylaria nigripes]|nr:hypothetical protein GGS21DRAFT_524218 [Xylaria nigripes]